MSGSVARLCTAPGCSKAAQLGRCADCRRRYDHARGTSAARGYDAAWRRVRQRAITEHPFCSCGAKAVAVDHVLSLAQGGVRLDARNLAPLCARCHGRKTAQVDGRWAGETKRAGESATGRHKVFGAYESSPWSYATGDLS
jgi:5-methylcytosine-specific restriction endonuclease McrA